MNNQLNEFEVIQNAAIGAHVFYEFIKRYENSNKDKLGPLLPFMFPVLPIVFTKEYAEQIANRNFKIGSFYKVITLDNSFFINIVPKMQELSETTYKALGLSFSSKILTYDKENSRIYTGRRVNILKSSELSKPYQNIIKSSQRLGSWFAQLKDDEIISYFNLNF
ncbi:MAG: hypothetical protein JEY96_19205 [Bacteroidales bacterium]|nr:hypothetical protein [Bacteroidales bacterium]